MWPDWVIFDNNFFTRVAKIYIDFLGYFGKHLFSVKNALLTFRLLMVKFGLLFISTSGHTVCRYQCLSLKSLTFQLLMQYVVSILGRQAVGCVLRL